MKFIRKALFVLLALILVICVTECFYLPRYLLSREEFDIGANQPGKQSVTVVSSNVRCWSPTDFFRKSWFYRAPLLMKTIAPLCPDIIGFQEVTPMHYSYLTKVLKGYDSVIEYRDDSPLHEACPVFYSTGRFDLVDKGSFWLSETPEEMSKDWGAACYRICSYVILAQKSDGKRLAVFNTHLDHISDEARINGIKVVLDKMKAFGDLPSILMGDLNADESSETYASATAVFDDAKYIAKDCAKGVTFHNWGKELDRENIDYFMLSKGDFDVSRYSTVEDTYDGVYPSDHFPITFSFVLK